MFNEAYPYRTSNFSKFFTFESISERRKVVKVVQFSQVGENVYNLGLADFVAGKLQYLETSNNHDVVRVLGTVGVIIRAFTDLYPEREVLITGENRRMKLYHLVLQRHWVEIEPDFLVWGLVDDEWEPYDISKFYEALRLKRKSE